MERFWLARKFWNDTYQCCINMLNSPKYLFDKHIYKLIGDIYMLYLLYLYVVKRLPAT